MFQSHLNYFEEESNKIVSAEEVLLPASIVEKNEIFPIFLSLLKSICNCLQSKVFGVGINQGPLEHNCL